MRLGGCVSAIGSCTETPSSSTGASMNPHSQADPPQPNQKTWAMGLASGDTNSGFGRNSAGYLFQVHVVLTEVRRIGQNVT